MTEFFKPAPVDPIFAVRSDHAASAAVMTTQSGCASVLRLTGTA